MPRLNYAEAKTAIIGEILARARAAAIPNTAESSSAS